MKNFLKKLHIMSNNNQPEDNGEGSNPSKGSHNNFVDGSSPDRILHSRTHHGHHHHDHSKPFSGLSGWLNSVGNRNNSPNLPGSSSSSNVAAGTELAEPVATVSGNSCVGLVDVRDSGSNNNSRDPDVEEEYQIQLALELSAREDPEAVQIEAVKQISLGSCAVDNTPAEVVAFRYWNYNVLGYDDKILDGFYDVYGILNESNSERMPSLIDLQGTPVLDSVTWEAVLVNKAADSNLLRLEQIALEMAVKSRSDSLVFVDKDLVRKLAGFVANYMGGPVGNPETMLREWQNLTFNLKATIGSLVLPLGSLKVGLARHRALLFKVLADSVNIPCRLVKGEQYTGSSDVAMNFVKLNDGREYIVDLMSDPGTLIPSDAAGSQAVYHGPFFYSRSMSRDNDSSHAASSSSWAGSSSEDHSEFGIKNSRSEKVELPPRPKQHGSSEIERESKMPSDDSKKRSDAEKGLGQEFTEKPGYPYAHARSPSWTEGVSSPAVRKKKVKDVSKYMIDAAKENPRLAQKLHDVLLESGVVAPPDLFTEAYPEQLNVTMPEANNTQRDEARESKAQDNVPSAPPPPTCFLPPLPHHRAPYKPEQSEISPAVKYAKNVPVAAAAAAAAAVVASSMVVAATKTSSSDGNLELPVAAATAAAVVVTTAAVSKQYEQGLRSSSDGDATDSGGYEQRDCSDHEAAGTATGERTSDKSVGNESAKSDSIESVADCEIPWEEIAVGERIGLGSYGEVYRGEWHGTEVAVKRFLDQEITGESLAEFMKEVQIMKKLRHPNVVLFMGAVTRAPNLSIVTEFLPRGSLYRLLHRPNNQLDERRRLRMALDAARGMNYLHNSTPVIVHRDLKSPNLLVDKNWVVKVCDFGLSKIKHSTFLSSRSTAGTAEWMAPEVLRNELSDEKCDVYSFGVILWELSTMQQPWGGMNPMQVVGAVGFQHRRLEIPDNMDPTIADIIRQCWQTDPKLRPTFAEIMATLKPLQRPITSPQGQRGRERAQPS